VKEFVDTRENRGYGEAQVQDPIRLVGRTHLLGRYRVVTQSCNCCAHAASTTTEPRHLDPLQNRAACGFGLPDAVAL
jgi:hypothetical protein